MFWVSKYLGNYGIIKSRHILVIKPYPYDTYEMVPRKSNVRYDFKIWASSWDYGTFRPP